MAQAQTLTFRFDPSRLRRARRHPAAPAVKRRRRADGPQDRAFYTCGCGYAFTANVSTTVGCPHCGTAQAW